MRTTIDLPDELFRRAKARAALDGVKLKDLIANYVEHGLKAAVGEEQAARVTARRRSPLPVIPRAAERGTLPALSHDALHAILDEEDAERANRPAGR